MTKQEELSKLIKIADFLDRNELQDEAALIDEVISDESAQPEAYEEDIEIPKEEYDLLQEIYHSFGQSIK